MIILDYFFFIRLSEFVEDIFERENGVIWTGVSQYFPLDREKPLKKKKNFLNWQCDAKGPGYFFVLGFVVKIKNQMLSQSRYLFYLFFVVTELLGRLSC